MTTIKVYDPSMQSAVESCFEVCMLALGWGYQPEGRHSDILNIENTYMRSGRFWCLFGGEKLIGMVAVRCIDEANRVAELKRLYLLPEYQTKATATCCSGTLWISQKNRNTRFCEPIPSEAARRHGI